MRRVLVPVEVLEGETLDAGVIDFLAEDHVVLLGYHVIPEQTAPEQARESFGDRANAALENIAAAIREVGGDVDERLVFTHDLAQTKRRVAAETECDAELRLGPAMTVDSILVVLHPEAAATDIASFAADHVVGTDRRLVLLSITAEETVARDSLAAAESHLDEAGVPADQIFVEAVVTDTPLDRIVDAATDTDLVVIGQRAPRAMDIILGDFVERIANETVGPVVVVRTETEE